MCQAFPKGLGMLWGKNACILLGNRQGCLLFKCCILFPWGKPPNEIRLWSAPSVIWLTESQLECSVGKKLIINKSLFREKQGN